MMVRKREDGPSKRFLTAIDKFDFVTLHEYFVTSNPPADKLIQKLSKKKFETLWNCILNVTLSLPPTCHVFSPERNEFDQEAENTPPLHINFQLQASSAQNNMSVRALPKDEQELTKMVIPMVSTIIPVFASKHKEPDNLYKILPIFMQLIEKELYIMEFLQISELMWKKGWFKREKTAGPALKLLLQKLNKPGATKKDARSLIRHRDALDVSEPWFESLAPELLKCFSNKVFMSDPSCVSFLADLHTLSPGFAKDCIEAMKEALVKPTATLHQATYFGYVIGLACLCTEPEIKEILERESIQFFLWKFIRLKWKDDNTVSTLGSLLFELLSGFQTQVDLHPAARNLQIKAYKPILWRNLTVSNNNFRYNAARLMLIMFPSESSLLTKEENERSLNAQYDYICDFLEDPCHMVRLTATKAVCSLLVTHWECLPNTFRVKTTYSLIMKLAFDRSCVEIRKQTLLGLAYIFKNGSYAICSFVGPKLKYVRPLIFDDSNVVVGAMVQLLLALQQVKHPIKSDIEDTVPTYFSVVPLTDIVRLLGTEKSNTPIMTSLVQLIYPTLHSEDPEMSRRHSSIKRVTWLIGNNLQAARNFYENSTNVLPVEKALRFMLKVLIALGKFYRSDSSGKNTSTPNRKRKRSMEDETTCIANSEMETSSQEEENCTQEHSSCLRTKLENPEIVAGLLDILFILWIKHGAYLADNSAETKDTTSGKLILVAKDVVHLVFKNWRDHEEVMHPLLLLASLLPMKTVRHMVSYSLSQLRQIGQKDDTTTTNVVSVLLTSLCNWNYGDGLLEMIGDSLTQTLEKTLPSNLHSKKRKRRQVAFEAKDTIKPEAALEYLRYIFKHPANHDYILTKAENYTKEFINKMDIIKLVLKNRLSKGVPSEHVSDEILHNILLRCVRIISLVRIESNVDFDVSLKYLEILTWAEKGVLPYQAQKYLNVELSLTEGVPLPVQVLNDVLRGATYVVHYDKASLEMCERLLLFLESCLDLDSATYSVPRILCVCSALFHHGVCVERGQRQGPIPNDMVKNKLTQIIRRSFDKCTDNDKLSLTLHDDSIDGNEISININMLINSFVCYFPQGEICKYSEQVFYLCTSFIRAILRITINCESPELPYSAKYFFTILLKSPINKQLIMDSLQHFINAACSEEELDALKKIMEFISVPKWKNVATASHLAKFRQMLEALESQQGPQIADMLSE